MMRDETTHGIHVIPKDRKAAVDPLADTAEQAGVAGFAITGRKPREEEVELEPLEEERAARVASDEEVRKYMFDHDHYASAYNAILHKVAHQAAVGFLVELFSAIFGKPVEDLPRNVDDETFSRMLHSAKMERASLLERVVNAQGTVDSMATSIASQQRLIHTMTHDSLNGRQAMAAIKRVAVTLGVPGDTPERELGPQDWADAILQKFKEYGDIITAVHGGLGEWMKKQA